MDCQVRISEAALADLEKILAYSWANFSATTEHFGNSILNHVDLLRTLPWLGSQVAGRSGVPQLVYTPIVITTASTKVRTWWKFFTSGIAPEGKVGGFSLRPGAGEDCETRSSSELPFGSGIRDGPAECSTRPRNPVMVLSWDHRFRGN